MLKTRPMEARRTGLDRHEHVVTQGAASAVQGTHTSMPKTALTMIGRTPSSTADHR